MSGDHIGRHILGAYLVALADIVMQFSDYLSFLLLKKVAENQ
jgi:hypothetical protein